MGPADVWGARRVTDVSLAEKGFYYTSLAWGPVLPNPQKTSEFDPKAPEKAKAGQQNQ